MNGGKFLHILTIMLTLAVVQGWTQLSGDARSLGMAFSNSADARGIEQIGQNPAALALRNGPNFELNLVSFAGGGFLNGLNYGIYDRYFTTGDTLTANDIDDILGSIPTNGLQASAFSRLTLLAFYSRSLSLSIGAIGNGFIRQPYDLFELVLKGNEQLGKTYNVNPEELSGFGALEVSIATSKEIPLKYFDFFAIGGAIRYLSGLQYAELTRAEGTVDNQATGIDVQVNLEGRRAGGGSGVAADFGAIAIWNKRWTFGLSFINLVGGMKWTTFTEQYLVTVRSNNPLTFPDAVDDSTIITQEDTSMVIDPFNTRLPVILDFSVAYRFSGSLIVTGEYEQALQNGMGWTTTPRLAMGVEYTGLKVIPLRAGINLGGRIGPAFALGSGINLHFLYLNVGMMWRGGFTPSSMKGIALGTTLRLRF